MDRPSPPSWDRPTAVVTTRPAPRWLRELTDARTTYEELLGWPLSIHVGRRVLTVAVGVTVGALTMPADLGAPVRVELCIATLRGPVLTEAGGRSWTFLTRPVGLLPAQVAGELARARVEVVRRGSQVPIPAFPVADARGPRVADERAGRWIEPPMPAHRLPPAYTVIAVTRRLLEHDLSLAA